MRADRLVSVLLLLQRRGQVTATEVANELEISARTARRDLEALGMAGLPVYSMPGRGGGWRLLGDGRTDLSGLSTPEAVALFTLIGRAPGGTSATTQSALRKLTRALPESMRAAAERAATSIRTVQPPAASSWPTSGPGTTQEVLATVQHCVVAARRAVLTYTNREQDTSTRTVDPLGLVQRGDRWYLVANTDAGQRTFRLDRIETFEPTDEPAVRPETYDLDQAWAQIETAINELRWDTTAQIRLKATHLGVARFFLHERLTLGPSEDGWISGTVRGWGVAELAALLAGAHPWLLVEGPAELRARLAQIGADLLASHGPPADSDALLG